MIRFVVINRPKGTGSRYDVETCKVGGSNPPRLAATTNADVAQMVRALACHARGREFETLHSRQLISYN